MVYESSHNFKCFECGDVDSKRFACLHRHRAAEEGEAGVPSSEPGEGEGRDREKPQNAPSPEVVGAERKPGREQADLVKGITIIGAVASSEDSVDGGAVSTVSPVPEVSEARQYELASLEEAGSKQLVTESQRNNDNDEMEYDSDLDGTSVAESMYRTGDLYTLNEINSFLDETFGKSVKAKDFFPNTEKFIKTVSVLQKSAGLDVLDDKKRYRLRM